MWFEQLTGFKEESSEQIRKNLRIEGDRFISNIDQRSFAFGELEILSLDELRAHDSPVEEIGVELTIEEIVADIKNLHCTIDNTNALFQVASQFNLLEMIDPRIGPEDGIDRYENDYTQGPTCAIACGAGTIYRNYFVNVGNQVGQSRLNQIDCLNSIGQEFNNEELGLWKMQNGYAMVNREGLLNINKHIRSLGHSERERLKGKLKIGIQWNTEVTQSISKHRVSQIYCSALPVAYCSYDSIYWENFSRLILEATYEATLQTALINLDRHRSNKVYLTLVGGGAFGNELHWILDSIQKAINKFRKTPLDIKIVSYGKPNLSLSKWLRKINA